MSDGIKLSKTDNPAKGLPLPDKNINPTLILEPDHFRADLEAFQLTREQENELLQTLWNIMAAFVDIGWGVDTVQMFLPDVFEKAVSDSGKLVESKDTQTSNEKAYQAERKSYD